MGCLRMFLLGLLCLFGILSIEAIEVRAIIQDATYACTRLSTTQAIFHGEYAFTDHIYCDPYSDTNLNDEVIRIREREFWISERLECLLADSSAFQSFAYSKLVNPCSPGIL